MIRVLPIFLAVALAVFCLVDCVQSDRGRIRYLPKALWLFLILIPVVGPLAWLFAGRPLAVRPPPPRPSAPPRTAAPRAPDDDPDFLAQLDERQRRAAREQGRAAPHDPPADSVDKDEDPESQRDSGS